MSKSRILIIEDQLLIAESTAADLNELGYEIAEIAHTFADAINKINNIEFDLALVDINLNNDQQGIQLGKLLLDMNKPFVYLTSYSDKDTIEKAKFTQPSGYIVKPADKVDLFTNIEIVMTRGLHNKSTAVSKKIKLNDGYNIIFVHPDDILWIKSDRIYLEIKLQNRTIIQRASFNNFLEKVEETNICRVHRSWAANLNHIQSYSAGQIVIQEKEIPISSSYKNEVQVRIQLK